MPIVKAGAAPRNNAISIVRSTGTCPAEWREWWREQSLLDGTDWRSLLDSADSVLRNLRKRHLVVVSS